MNHDREREKRKVVVVKGRRGSHDCKREPTTKRRVRAQRRRREMKTREVDEFFVVER